MGQLGGGGVTLAQSGFKNPTPNITLSGRPLEGPYIVVYSYGSVVQYGRILHFMLVGTVGLHEGIHT
jgi:hypothetical protein